MLLKINDEKILNIKTTDGKLFLNEKKVKKYDKIEYRCDKCSITETIHYRYNKKFNNHIILCTKCARKQTNIEHFGVENISQSSIIQKTIREKSIEKYGTKHFLSSPKVRKKIKQTNIEKYGVDEIFKLKGFKEETKKIMIERYGVEYSLQSNEIKNKYKTTMLEKYKVDKPMHSTIIKDKRRLTIQSNIKNELMNFKEFEPLFALNRFRGINHIYMWKCNKCNSKFEDHLKNGHIPRCPKCYPRNIKIDRKVNNLHEWLKTLNIGEIQLNNKELIKPFNISIYLPNHNLAIELVSLYWHSEIQGRSKDYHLIKSLRCSAQNIQMIYIFEDEWVYKQEAVKSIIKRKLNLITNNINAKECKVGIISNKQAKAFYVINNIKSFIYNKINIALFYNNEIVSCLSISKPRFNKNYNWEITRFSNKTDLYIINGFNKMLQYFKKEHNGSIIAYGDCRYYDSNIYENNNFEHINQSEPNYHYTNYVERFARFKFNKKKLKKIITNYNPNLTEWQNMQLEGWDRVWDVGNDVYVLIS